MVQTFTTDIAARAVAGGVETQKFGRIEAIRPAPEGVEIDIRQPDGAILVTCLDPGGLDAGMVEARIGRNIWVSGRIDGDAMIAAMFMVYAEEP